MPNERTHNYRDMIRNAYVDRARKNPRYSLRQFATQNGIAPSTLVEVLSGKKNLSAERAHTLGVRLGFRDRQLEYFCALAQFESTRSAALKCALQEKISRDFPEHEVRDLSVDHFKSISEWYHLPILELAELESFDFSPANCAEALGISTEEAIAAIHRLQRLELLTSQKGRFRKSQERLLVTSAVPNEALRAHHRQMLERTIHLLERDAPARRIMRTENLAFSPAKLERARALTQAYIDQILSLAEEPGSGAPELFHLGVQFFRITDSPVNSSASENQGSKS